MGRVNRGQATQQFDGVRRVTSVSSRLSLFRKGRDLTAVLLKPFMQLRNLLLELVQIGGGDDVCAPFVERPQLVARRTGRALVARFQGATERRAQLLNATRSGSGGGGSGGALGRGAGARLRSAGKKAGSSRCARDVPEYRWRVGAAGRCCCCARWSSRWRSARRRSNSARTIDWSWASARTSRSCSARALSRSTAARSRHSRMMSEHQCWSAVARCFAVRPLRHRCLLYGCAPPAGRRSGDFNGCGDHASAMPGADLQTPHPERAIVRRIGRVGLHHP
jgi:hypothetical protein